MKPNEALIFKVYDSKTTAGIAKRVPHTSFQIDGTEHIAPRESIEFQSLVFWEDQKSFIVQPLSETLITQSYSRSSSLY